MTTQRPYGDDPVKARLFTSYRMIRQIVYNPNNCSHQRHAREGIDLSCDWDSFDEFYNWVLKKLGPPPFPGARIVRKDQTRAYTRRNLEWNTHREQCRRFRSCQRITYRGKTLNLTDWSQELGISIYTIYYRWSKGITDPKKLFKKGRLNASS